jgi:Flp pilus assembly protein TadD
VLVLAAVLAFSNSFSGAFVLDDIPAIPENPHVRSLTPLRQALGAPAESTASGRPVVSLTLALNYALSTDRGAAPTPYPFHVGNLVIHVFAGLALFGVVRHTLRTPSLSTRFGEESTAIATSIALLWLVHPLQTAAVTYIVQRAEALMGLFLFLTLYCTIRSHASFRTWSVAAVVACALGMGSKESMFAAPLIAVAWDWLFGRRAGEDARQLWQRRWALYAGLASTWLLLALTVSSEQRPASVGFHFADWPWWRYLATQAGVILHYLRLVFLPSPLVLDYGWPPVSSLVGALPELTVVAGLVILTAFGLFKRHPASFAGVVFFLVLAPSSSLLPIVTEVAAEHRMYVPLAAVIGLIIIACVEAGRRWRIPAFAGIVALSTAAGALGWLTYSRNADYASEERIWADTIGKRPDNPTARVNYGVVLLAQGRTSEAEPHLRKAVELAPDEDEAQLALGAALCSTGRCDEGIPHFRRAVELDPDDPGAVRNLAEALASRGERREAAVHFRRAVELLPNDVFVLNQASWLLATAPEDDVRDGQAALMMAERAVRLTGGRDPVSLDSLAVAYAELGRFEEASTAIQQAIAGAQQQRAVQLEQQLQDHRQLIEAGRPIR